MPEQDIFRGRKDALEFAYKAYSEGRLIATIRKELADQFGLKIARQSLEMRLKRMAVRRATRAAESAETAAERAELTTDATAALAGQGSEPLRRRRRLLKRAEEIWTALPARMKRSWKLYISLEELALKYLALQFRVAQVTGDGDALAEASETLKVKLTAMMAKAATPPAPSASASAPAPPRLDS